MNERTRAPAPVTAGRCPYCRVDLTEDDGVACAGCHTRHHPGCFAEHGSCSTFGCTSRAADAVTNPAEDRDTQLENAAAWGRVGSNRQGFAWWRRGLRPNPACPCCDAPWGDASLVARCGCNEIMHADCYEERGACPGSMCAISRQWPVRIMTPAQAQTRNRADATASFRTLGLLFGIPTGLLLIASLLTGAKGTAILSGLMFVVCLTQYLAGVFLRPRPAEAPDPAPAPTPATKTDPKASDPA